MENESPGTAIDPICNMKVDRESALSAERDGQTFYFCSEQCRQKFLSAPAATEKPEEKPRTAQAMYTCPMHPEIEQDHPGECPKCGMALEAKTTTSRTDGEENAELRDMTRRFWIGAALTLPVFTLAMTHLIPALGRLSWVQSDASRWLQCILTTPVVLWAGWPFFQRGWRSVVNRHLNMFTLISIGVGAAFVFSVVVMLMPGLFPPAMLHKGKVAIYFEAAAMISGSGWGRSQGSPMPSSMPSRSSSSPAPVRLAWRRPCPSWSVSDGARRKGYW